MKNEIAILMAAGLGSRMYPLTETIPKPLVRVHDIPMIETMIRGLRSRGVNEIYVVVGYLKQQFEYLQDKYVGLKLIENTEYATKNNIASLYAARAVLGSSDCFICESDVYVKDRSIFEHVPDQSCYFAKMIKGYSADWVFDMDGLRLTHIHQGGTNQYNMVGVTYLKHADAQIIANAVVREYMQEENGQLYWDQVVDKELGNIKMTIHTVSEDSMIELDTVEELNCYQEKQI